jgi:hypothetical protein
MPSGVGCTYRCETVTLLWPAIFIIVNALAWLPQARQHRVAKRVHNEFLEQFQRITHVIVLMVNRRPRIAASGSRRNKRLNVANSRFIEAGESGRLYQGRPRVRRCLYPSIKASSIVSVTALRPLRRDFGPAGRQEALIWTGPWRDTSWRKRTSWAGLRGSEFAGSCPRSRLPSKAWSIPVSR